MRRLTRLESGLRAYGALALNLVAGLVIYYGIVTGCGSGAYAELALATAASSLGVLLAYSFQAGMIEECAIRLGKGEEGRARRMLARYELLGVGAGVGWMGLGAVAAMVCGRVEGWNWGVFAGLSLANVVAGVNAPRHALLFAQGRAGETAGLQCLHAGTRLAVIGGGFWWFGPGPGVVAVATFLGSLVVMGGYRRVVSLEGGGRRRVTVRWVRAVGRGWREIVTVRRLGSVLLRNGDQFQGFVEQVLFGAVGHALRVAYTLMLPLLSLLKQGTYAGVAILESEYASTLGREEARRAGVAMRVMFWGGAVAGAVWLRWGWVPPRLGAAMGPLREELWVVPAALILFPLLIARGWDLAYRMRAHVYVGAYLAGAVVVGLGLRLAMAAGVEIAVSFRVVVGAMVAMQVVQLGVLAVVGRGRES